MGGKGVYVKLENLILSENKTVNVNEQLLIPVLTKCLQAIWTCHSPYYISAAYLIFYRITSLIFYLI